MKLNRSGIFRGLNVSPKNERWAWCAKNDFLKTAVFTIWDDEENNGVWLLHDEDQEDKRPGYSNQKEVLNLSISEKYEVYGILATAKDPKANTRLIKSVKSDSLFVLKLFKSGDNIFGRKTKEVAYLDLVVSQNEKIKNDAINDLADNSVKSTAPDRALTIGYSYKRDNKVRLAVLARAQGKCEYCNTSAFTDSSGNSFLEAHHIIMLAKEGKDTIDNVIALCPNHHREAHYGLNALELEKKFVSIVDSKNPDLS